MSDFLVDTGQGMLTLFSQDGGVNGFYCFNQCGDLVQLTVGRGVLLNGFQLGQRFASFLVFIQRWFVLVETTQGQLQLLPGMQLVGEELV
ncbi:hypothetical protein D3C85_1291490 [compost metagenome]